MAKPRYVYRVRTKSGETWCETSDPQEALQALSGAGKGARLERCYSTVVWSSWEQWDGVDDASR